MGVTIREKPKGSGVWYVFISEQGRRKSYKVGAKSEAAKLKRELEYASAKGRLHLSENVAPELYSYARSWADNFIQSRRSAGTYTRYIGIIEHQIKPALGSKRIDTISRGDIKEFLLNQFSKGSSASAVDLFLTVLSGIFNAALDDEIVAVNPCSNLSRTLDLNRSKKREKYPLTGAETEAIMKTVRSKFSGYYPFFLTAFRTAARLGELCALRWSDINWTTGHIWIRRTAKDQTVKESTKTYTIRQIELSQELIAELMQHKKRDAAECLKLGIEQRYIFHSGGHLYGQNTVRRIWERVLKQSGVDRRRFHEIRHTTASTLLARGAPLTAVSAMLGHSSPQITLTVYAHDMPSEHVGFTKLLDGTIKGHAGEG